jgi:hypothetical protein
MRVKSDDADDPVCFPETAGDDALEIRHFAVAPRLKVLLRQHPHSREHRRGGYRQTPAEELSHGPGDTGIEGIGLVILGREFLHAV